MQLLEQNKNLKNFSTFRTEAISKYFFEITNDNFSELPEILEFAKNNNLKTLFIWWGSNILFAFDFFEWIIIKNSLKWFEVVDNTLEIYSWELISPFSYKLQKEFNNQIFSRWIWLPGTIWWAIIWNAGCFGLEIKDYFLEADLLNLENWDMVTVDKEFMKFDYRYSFLKENWNKFFIIKAKFSLDWVVDNIDWDAIEERKKKQPTWFTCGSFFKNPKDLKTWETIAAWKLIDEVWMKWFVNWWIKISELHWNFFINFNNWTYQEILDLQKLAKFKVFEKFWIELQEEVQIIKN